MSENSELEFDTERRPTPPHARGDDAARSIDDGSQLVRPSPIATPGAPQTGTGGTAIVDPGVEWTEALLETLSDRYSRKIFCAAVARGRTIDEICSEQRIPPSSCYKKVKHLVDQGLMIAERQVVTGGGKKYTIYRSTFTYMSLNIEGGATSVRVVFNKEIIHKLNHRMFRRGEKREASTAFSPRCALGRGVDRDAARR